MSLCVAYANKVFYAILLDSTVSFGRYVFILKILTALFIHLLVKNLVPIANHLPNFDLHRIIAYLFGRRQ